MKHSDRKAGNIAVFIFLTIFGIFMIFPIYSIKTSYLQLENYGKKVTSNKLLAGILRMLMSLLKTPYCTGIVQVTSSLYQFFTVNMIFHKNFIINEDGNVVKRGKNEIKVCKLFEK